jgi:hypothetical protein
MRRYRPPIGNFFSSDAGRLKLTNKMIELLENDNDLASSEMAEHLQKGLD